VCYGGLHTEIKWVFPKIPGGDYLKTIHYQTLVDLELTDSAYSIGNTTWGNDHTGSRLYTGLWGGGTFIQHEKAIVLEMGETPEQDKLAENGYSVVKEGGQVTYRLTLRSTEAGTFALSGVNMADNLPDTFGLFEWQDRINITDVKIVGNGVSCTAEAWKNAWSVGSEYGGFLGADEQYILWTDEASISFTEPGEVHIYYTLTFPSDGEDGLWSQYTDAVCGDRIENTLYVYRYPTAVEHELWETGKVILQKGVAGTYVVTYRVFPGNSRMYYNSADNVGRRIVYYVTLYNGGNKRLYLNEMQDTLPKGFAFGNHMAATASVYAEEKWLSGTTITTDNGATDKGEWPLVAYDLPEDAPDVRFRSVTVTGTGIEGGVNFSFSAGSGDNAISYDAERGKYYLNRNEAIVFGYYVTIDTTENTELNATNTITMAYEDYLDTGVKAVSEDAVGIGAGECKYFTDYNDGDRQVRSAEDGKDWLVSQVTSTRGGIGPGVTKYTDSYISSDGDERDYVSYAGPGDTVTWRIRIHNTGTMAMTDFTLTDVIPAPYVVEGVIGYEIYAQPRNHDIISVAGTKLCTFPTERNAGETEVTFNDNTWAWDPAYKVTFGADEMVQTNKYAVSMSRDDAGNEVISIRFNTKAMTIPEGGYMDVYISARNPTQSYINRVFTNRAMLTPNAQTFKVSDVANGRVMRNVTGELLGVESAAPMTVSFGYATTSENQVTDKADTENDAVSSDPAHNRITLANATDPFTYTLTVKNDTDQ
ncbi:MAG: hypothetical protein U0L15_09025, partial [Oscillospiraceae bacterium]|nr:hypothetical protein [Oscillospiraceae bacterium]